MLADDIEGLIEERDPEILARLIHHVTNCSICLDRARILLRDKKEKRKHVTKED